MAPGLHPLVRQQPGFIAHVAYPIAGLFAVGDVRESRVQQEAWYDEFVAPSLLDPDALSGEYFAPRHRPAEGRREDSHFAVAPSGPSNIAKPPRGPTNTISDWGTTP